MSEQGNFLSVEELSLHIQGCIVNDRLSQKKIYHSFYGYALTICNRYSNNYEDSIETLNDGFLKVFKEIYRYKPLYADIIASFKGWIRTIMIYTAIDHYRKKCKQKFYSELGNEAFHIPANIENAVDRISYQEIVNAIQELTPGYRIIFNLFVIEGISHQEIAKRLGISIGSSKSNLARGRKQLQKILSGKYHLSPLRETNSVKFDLQLLPELN